MGATISDVADLANVSVATVDRVLHGRSGVSVKTLKSVKDAIHQLGFGQLPTHLIEPASTQLKFLFLLPKIDSGFISEIIDAVYTASNVVANVEAHVEIRRVDFTTGADIVAELDNLDPEEFQGVGMVAFDAPGVSAAIDSVHEKGVPVVTLVSDIPSSSRQTYIGIDNMAAGRTAGRLMGKFLRNVAGEIGVIVGNMSIRDHLERYSGIRQIISHNYPTLTLLPPEECNSLAERNRTIVRKMINEHPDMVGLYNAGGGNSGFIDALRRLNPSARPVSILHETTKEVRNALKNGIIDAVVAQNPTQIARGAVSSLISAVLGGAVHSSMTTISIDVYVEDNLP